MTTDNRSIIDLLKSEIEFNGTATASKEFDQKGVEALAPLHDKGLEAPLSYAQVKSARAIDKALVVSAAAALAEVCQDQLVDNKELANASGEVKFGNNVLKVNVKRSAEVSMGIGKDAKTRTVVGRMVKSVTTNHGPALNKVVADIEARSAEVGLKA